MQCVSAIRLALNLEVCFLLMHVLTIAHVPTLISLIGSSK